jgi:hypothetical protein
MTKLQTLKRELKYSLFAYLLFKNQNEAQLKWGQTPNRTQEEKQLAKCKTLILRIRLHQEHYEFLNN